MNNSDDSEPDESSIASAANVIENVRMLAREAKKNAENASVSKNAAVEQTTPLEKPKGHNDIMTNPTREEIDAKLDSLSARSDARARETELQAEARLARFEERIDQAIGEMRRDRADTAKKIDDLQAEVRTEAKSMKNTLIITAISSFLAIVGGVAAFNATVLGNMTASFEAGKTTMQSINETTNRLEALQSKIEAQAASRAATSQNDPPKK